MKGREKEGRGGLKGMGRRGRVVEGELCAPLRPSPGYTTDCKPSLPELYQHDIYYKLCVT